jgi:LysM repeat protein
MDMHQTHVQVAERLEAVRPSSLKKRLRERIQLFLADRKLVRYALVSLNILLLLSIAWFTLGPTYHGQPLGKQGVITVAANAATEPLDQLSSADIALQAAVAVGMDPEIAITPVVNQSYDVQSELALTPVDTAVIAKPLLVPTPFKSRNDIKDYAVQPGDTVASIASKFGVTSDSIMWSNGLRGNALAEGQNLVIPPQGVNGIVYVVQPGDTVDSLARKFRADRQQLIAFNDIELTGLNEGERILVPGGLQPVQFTTVALGLVYGGNGYIRGYCTWHVANRRAAVGMPLPSNLGNASSWYRNAIANGLATGYTPKQYAVLWHVDTSLAGGLGHVGFVERVNDDGSIVVSDMNYTAGYGRISTRTIQPSEFGNYRFIY